MNQFIPLISRIDGGRNKAQSSGTEKRNKPFDIVRTEYPNSIALLQAQFLQSSCQFVGTKKHIGVCQSYLLMMRNYTLVIGPFFRGFLQQLTDRFFSRWFITGMIVISIPFVNRLINRFLSFLNNK